MNKGLQKLLCLALTYMHPPLVSYHSFRICQSGFAFATILGTFGF